MVLAIDLLFDYLFRFESLKVHVANFFKFGIDNQFYTYDVRMDSKFKMHVNMVTL